MSALSHPDAYEACLAHVAAASAGMMDGLVDKAQTRMRLREKTTDMRERNQIAEAVNQLARHKAALRAGYPQQLLDTIGRFHQPDQSAEPVADLHFDELELMDDVQVQENVELARIQQAAMLAVDAELAELDAYMSSVMGLATVQPDRNPFRPQSFGEALRQLLQQVPVGNDVRLRWMHNVGAALGSELRPLYAALNALLQQRGLAKAAYTVTPSPETRTAQAGRVASTAALAGAAAAGGGAGSTLTMDQLHRLLTGELENPGQDLAEVVAQYARAAPGAAGQRFDATVPAALEALQDMQQLGAAVQRLRKTADDPLTLGQRLGREVVHLMVESMTQDARLLPPVHDAVARLEPALLQLARGDPRFFSDKHHPARVLLDRITRRSLAFPSADAPGFATMMEPVEQCVQLLRDSDVADHLPFEAALVVLDRAWTAQEKAARASRSQAVQALLQAEQRNLLAQKIAEELDRRPDALHAPAFVRAFLTGPWAQVMARAQTQGLEEAGTYAALVDDLLWSARPELIRSNRQRLVRIIPVMLPQLRAGLAGIDFPAEQAADFFSQLMQVHQEGIRPPAGLQSVARPAAPADARTAFEARFEASQDSVPWLAPSEARESGFLDAAETLPPPSVADTEPMTLAPEDLSVVSAAPPARAVPDLRLGASIEFLIKGQWVQAQLDWTSPHGTLFMFTRSNGQPYSMTRKTMDRLRASNALRVVAQPDVVAGALDAVARTALRNSVDVPS